MSNNWSALKETLVKKGRLHSSFLQVISVTPDSLSAERFEPLLVARNNERLADLLEKCMTLRREIQELEILAVKAAVDYDLFLATSAIDEEAEILRLNNASKAVRVKSESAAASAFGDLSPINSGFKTISDGNSQSLSEELTAGTRLAELIKNRWSNVRTYQAAYHSRYNEKGNAHNYAQRAGNLTRILKRELGEAVQRAVALESGLNTIYGWTPGPLPANYDMFSLDDFVLWALAARRELGLRSEGESTFDIVVPLVQPWLQNGAGLIAKDVFDKAIGTPTDQPIVLPFDVSKSLFLGQDVRLRGVGLAFGNKFKQVVASGIDGAETSGRFARLAATLVTPKQVSASGAESQRPAITLGNVGLHQSGRPDAFSDDVAVENIYPVGKWEVHIHPWIVWKNGDVNKLSDGVDTNPILDLKVTFRAYVPAR